MRANIEIGQRVNRAALPRNCGNRHAAFPGCVAVGNCCVCGSGAEHDASIELHSTTKCISRGHRSIGGLFLQWIQCLCTDLPIPAVQRKYCADIPDHSAAQLDRSDASGRKRCRTTNFSEIGDSWRAAGGDGKLRGEYRWPSETAHAHGDHRGQRSCDCRCVCRNCRKAGRWPCRP